VHVGHERAVLGGERVEQSSCLPSPQAASRSLAGGARRPYADRLASARPPPTSTTGRQGRVTAV
jgi:hypothetical protein